MFNHSVMRVSLTMFFALLLAGCSENKLDNLNIGTNVWPGYEPLYLAREKQFIDNDLITLVELSTASQVIQAYRNEVIDAAAVTLDEALLLLENGEKFSIVLIFDISNGSDAIIGQSTIKSFSELKGKVVGLESSALGAYMLTRALETFNMSLDDIRVKHLNVEEHDKAFVKNEVDAVVSFEPVKSRLKKSGGHILFDSSQIPNEIIDVLIVRQSYLENNNANVQQLINAWFTSLSYIEQYPEQAMKLLNMRMKLPASALIHTFDGLVLGNAAINIRLLQNKVEILSLSEKLMAVMLKKGLLQSSFEINILLSNKIFNYSSKVMDRSF